MAGVWELSVTDNGFVTRSVTIEVLEDLLRHCKKNQIKLPVIVYADGFKGHYGLEIAEFCEENQIKMIFLKPNTTHACQPLDLTSFAALKREVKKLSHSWHGMKENTNKKLDKYTIMKDVLYNAVENVFSNPATIQSGFRRACLFPFGPENMDWSKFSSSKVFARPGQENVEICNNLINNNNMYPAPEFCGDAEDIADPVLRAHPLPPPAEISVRCQMDVAASVPASVSSSSIVTAQKSFSVPQTQDSSDPLLSQLSPYPVVCEAPTVPNTPYVTPVSSVSGPSANTDTDPLIEPFPAGTLTHTAQSSSAPHAAPLFSLQTSGHQTLSVSVTLPATAADLLSLEDRITASLVNKQKSLSHDKKVTEIRASY